MATQAIESKAAKRLPLLTASRLKDERACARLGYFKYVLGYRSAVESETLLFGRLLHLGLEAWWLAPAKDESALELALAAVRKEPADDFDRVKVEELTRGYHFRWQDEPLEAIAIEAEFHAPLINPATGAASKTFALAGKVDGIVRETGGSYAGRVCLIEHKSSAEEIGPGSDYRARLRMDSQISVYYDGARSLGHEVEACIYDVVHKPTIRPAKATPLETRKYTQGKPCKVEHYQCECANAEPRAEKPCHATCRMCLGNGWNELPRPYANQREQDETPEDFRARLREHIATRPEEYYQRFEVVRLEAEMEEARFDVWQTALILRDNAASKRWPRNPDACIRFGSKCMYWPICTGETSIEDESRYIRDANLHPELSNPTA